MAFSTLLVTSALASALWFEPAPAPPSDAPPSNTSPSTASPSTTPPSAAPQPAPPSQPEPAPKLDAPPQPEPAPKPELASTEVVRVKRDFGKPHFDLVIDGWTDGDAERLHDARLWWSNTSEQGKRKPLGRMIERMVHLKYRRLSGTVLTVKVAGDGKEFTFTVELGKDAAIHAYVAVDTEAGKFIPRCRTTGARLLARRVLGVPVGISRIEVTCRDGQGAEHRGQIRHRDV